MAHNRLREFRKERGLTLEQLSDLSGISQGHLSRLEMNRRLLLVPVAERLAGVLAVRVSDLLGLDDDEHAPPGATAPKGFADDIVPYQPQPGDPLAALAGGDVFLHRVTSNGLSKIGIQAGDIVRIDISAAATRNVEPLKVVQVRLHPKEDFMQPITLLRQFVPPRLLITNSAEDNLPSIDMDDEDANIVGVMVGKYRSFT